MSELLFHFVISKVLAMTDNAITSYKLKRIITLSQLKPNEYCLWVIQMKTTFQVHKCLNIVLSREPNSISLDDGGTLLEAIDKQFQVAIIS